MAHQTAEIQPGAVIREGCVIGPHAFIEAGAYIGDRVHVGPNVCIFDGVAIENDVFIGPNVTFMNDRRPKWPGRRIDPAEWRETRVLAHAMIGAGAVIFPVVIGACAVVGAGAVVTQDVESRDTVVGNPARVVREGSYR